MDATGLESVVSLTIANISSAPSANARIRDIIIPNNTTERDNPMRSILEELFYGNVCPNTDCRNKEKETKELIGYNKSHSTII